MSGGWLPKRIMLGNLEGAMRRGWGGKEKEWTDCIHIFICFSPNEQGGGGGLPDFLFHTFFLVEHSLLNRPRAGLATV